MSMSLGLHNIQVNTASLADGHSLAAYLTSAAGTLLTNTTIGAKEHLDVKGPSEFIDSSAYATGVDYLTAMAVVNNAGNYVPLTLNAAGELPVSATVNFAGDYAEDSPAASGDIGLFTLLVRQDTLAASTSTDGDYGAFKSNNLGELYTHDTSALAQLVTANATLVGIKSDTASIVTNTGTIVTNTGTTATNTGTIASTLTALSKAEDAAASSGDTGIQALAVRKDAQGSNAGTDGDYTSLQTWSEGSLKVVDVANGTILQQQVSVTNTAAQVPAANLASRKTLMLQNTGANKLYIGSATVTSSGATTGIELPANSFMELECGPAVNVYAVKVGATGNNLNVLEMA